MKGRDPALNDLTERKHVMKGSWEQASRSPLAPAEGQTLFGFL